MACWKGERSGPYTDVDPGDGRLRADVRDDVRRRRAWPSAAGLGGGALLGRPERLARFRRAWPFVAGAGLTSVLFGLLYGEFFGPTRLVPVLWLEPVSQPIPLLLAAISGGTVLLGGAYLLGSVNRWREGGARTRCRSRHPSPVVLLVSPQRPRGVTWWCPTGRRATIPRFLSNATGECRGWKSR
jgi:hypothetical protein